MLKSLLFILGFPYGQDTIPLIFSEKILEAHSQKIEDKLYDDAIEGLLSIQESDSNYYRAQKELIVTYTAIGDYEKAYQVGAGNLDKWNDIRVQFYIELGNSFLAAGEVEKGADIYEQGLRLFPYNPTLIYNRGLAHYRMKEYEEAVTYFQRALSINPYHSNSHLMLGTTMLLSGYRTKAILSYFTYLAINPGNNKVLVTLENLVNTADRSEGIITPVGTNQDFSYYDDLIRSKAALNDAFVQQVDFRASIIKQGELLFDKWRYNPDSDDFWMKFYMPMFTGMRKENLQVAFLYFILYSVGNDDVNAWLEKHTTEKSRWIDLANKSLKLNRESNVATLQGTTDTYTHWFYDNNALSAIGNLLDNDTRIGPWVFFHDNSEKSAEGRYNQQGRKVGTWTYYYANGITSQVEYYEEDGSIHKPMEYYFEDGTLSNLLRYRQDTVDGYLDYYYACGTLKEQFPYTKGEKTGTGHYYFETGELQSDYQLTDGKLDGTYVTYFRNGKIKNTYLYDAGTVNGTYTSYYTNGQLEETGEYADDLMVGNWVGYYDNGTKKYEGSFEDGNRVGIWAYFFADGTRQMTEEYGNNGELEGPSEFFDEDGIRNSRYIYRADTLVEYVFFDKKGTILAQEANPSGNMAFKSYYPTGELRESGQLTAGKLSGPVKRYYPSGQLHREGNMVQNEWDGEFKEYSEAGPLLIHCNYQNGQLDGYYRAYHLNGTVANEGWYIDGQAEQIWQTYFIDGTLYESTYFKNNLADGLSKEYATDGRLFQVYQYKNGMYTGVFQYDTTGAVFNQRTLKNGTGKNTYLYPGGKKRYESDLICGLSITDQVNYYPSGKKETVLSVKNGEYHGPYEYNGPDGKAILKGHYVNGLASGLWTRYFENGVKDSDRNYKGGNLQGTSTYFHENGKTETTCVYDEDERNGPCTYYDADGNLQMIKLYRKDAGHIGYLYAKPNGTYSDTIFTLGKKDFELKAYFDNGNVSCTQQYKNGYFDGKTIYYHKNGNIQEDIDFKMGDYHGWYKAYYPNGKPRIETPYYFDEREGTETEFYP
ncbi:MAG: tetratricopeptide repeat protein, partial [Cyclobacteriaceae bacterium]|nr:tetratricopeptide repeat protein [Cyclobacteriaceae bacterium]